MKSCYIVLVFLLLSWVVGYAQLNESDTVKFQVRVGLTGNYQQGNLDVLALRARIDILYAPVKNFVFKSQNSLLYQEFTSKKADNDIFSRNYFYYKPQKTIYPFAIAYISTNYRRKFDRRVFAGAGVTWRVLNKRYHVMKLSGSLVYEESKFNGSIYNFGEYNGSNKVKLWRGTVYLGGWDYLFDRKIRLYYDAYWQPSFDNKNNYRAQFDIGTEFSVWKGLAFMMVYTFTHEHVTITAVKQEDRMLSFGASYYFRMKD